MNDLAAWLLEQIAEDEFRYQRARLAGEVGPNMTSLWLAECAAKRRIVEEAGDISEHGDPRRLLALLALPYADRSGYLDEWRPAVVAS